MHRFRTVSYGYLYICLGSALLSGAFLVAARQVLGFLFRTQSADSSAAWFHLAKWTINHLGRTPVAAAAFTLLFTLCFALRSRQYAADLREIARGAQELAEGNVAGKVRVMSGGELRDIAVSLNLAMTRKGQDGRSEKPGDGHGETDDGVAAVPPPEPEANGPAGAGAFARTAATEPGMGERNRPEPAPSAASLPASGDWLALGLRSRALRRGLEEAAFETDATVRPGRFPELIEEARILERILEDLADRSLPPAMAERLGLSRRGGTGGGPDPNGGIAYSSERGADPAASRTAARNGAEEAAPLDASSAALLHREEQP